MTGEGFRSVLVTGANGFVGRRLAAALSRNLGNAALTLCGSPSADQVAGYRRFDLGDAAAINALVGEVAPDLVIHLAGQTSVGQSACSSAATWEINLVGTFRLAQALGRHAPNATMFFTSSADVYGAAFNDGVVSEESALKPLSVYARSKAAAEAVLADILPPQARLIVVRPSNHSGAGQDARFALPSFAAQIAEAEVGIRDPVMKVGNLDAERDFMHVDAVIDTYCQLLAKASDLPMRATVNVASGIPVRIRALLDTMLEMSKLAIAVEMDPDRLRPSDVAATWLATDRLRQFDITPPAAADDRLLREILEDQRLKVRGQ